VLAVDPAASPTKQIGAFGPPLMRPMAEAMTDGRGRECRCAGWAPAA
jgi:hypothetical protein